MKMGLPWIFSRAVRTMILCVVLLLTLGTGSEDGFARIRRTVRMTNDLGGGLDLTIHCKQRNEDLGEHLLQANESYEFSFKPNFWGTTLYFCSFSWPGAFYWFEIFVMKRDHDNCVTCIWQIRQDKPCRLGKKSHVFDDCFKWRTNSSFPLLS